MDNGETVRRLAAITDAGVFERLASAVLRESNSQYRFLTHPGVNLDGKTVKAPIDGIAFVTGSDPPHMIAVHHTTCKRGELEEKWLHDPATAKPRKAGSRPVARPGDLLKTVKIFQEQKKKTPELRATLILTTNEEPPESLVREVNAIAYAAGLALEIWSRSVLAHFLDFDPKGQWIRRDFLRIEQERLSGELLQAISQRSLEYHAPPDCKELWIERTLDHMLEESTGRDIVFVVADSGLGKSVACYKRLMAHVEAGGYGLILPHNVIARALSFDDAIEAALRQLHPALVPGCGSAARALASEHAPLIVVVEDVNRSGQPTVLIEKLAGWGVSGKRGSQSAASQIICPVWPRVLASLGDEARKRVDALALMAKPFTAQEGADAVQRRRERSGIAVTSLEAEAISSALGHDPLLIALHDPAEEPAPDTVIGRFIASSLARLAHDRGEFTGGEYREALRRMAAGMLERRRLDLTMVEAAGWFSAAPDIARMLRHIASFGEIIHVAGCATDERLAFRHDRVRDWLLADAAADLLGRGAMPDAVLTEPYFAEVIGAALVCSNVPVAMAERTKNSNPLALFCALRLFGNSTSRMQGTVLVAAGDWLDNPAAQAKHNFNLRWEVQRVLSETESSNVIALTRRFDQPGDWWARRARFRNGDVMAGIELCFRHELGVSVAGHLELIDYVQNRSAGSLVRTLGALLLGNALRPELRAGALRLAGHVGDPALAGAIEASWQSDAGRRDHLRDYLWACARCGGEDPARLLDPVCAAWVALPNEPTKGHSEDSRNGLAAHGVRWAFQKQGLPEPTLRYFIGQARGSELRWAITFMLHGFDHPDALEFIARELAATQEELEGTKKFSPFVLTARDEWRRRQDRGRAISVASRSRLRELWKDGSHGKHLRKEAFRLWSATIARGDVPILRAVSASDILADSALSERLRRGDRLVIPGLIAKLRQSDPDRWWHLGQYVWTDELTDVMDEELTRRGARVKREWGFEDAASNDWATYELLMRLPVKEAESLMFKHWEHLRFSSYFVQTALYIATPNLTKAAAAAVTECPDPKALFLHLTSHFGYKTIGHPGVTRIAQVESLLPYLDHLSDLDIQHLWEICNDHGWFGLRRQHIDSRLTLDRRSIKYTDDALATAELDKMIAEGRASWADHWVDGFLKAGVSADHLIELVRVWLMRQTEIAALQLAAHVVIHAGSRPHLNILTCHNIEPADQAASVIANASFAVRRRSLN